MPYILVQAFCVMYPWLPKVVAKVISLIEVGTGQEFVWHIVNGWLVW